MHRLNTEPYIHAQYICIKPQRCTVMVLCGKVRKYQEFPEFMNIRTYSLNSPVDDPVDELLDLYLTNILTFFFLLDNLTLP